MKLNQNSGGTKFPADGYSWLCRPCGTRRSVRKGSIFESSRLSLKQILTFVYCWAHGLSQEQAIREAKVGSQWTAVNLYRKCRDICEVWLVKNSSKVGGLHPATGQPIAVELGRHSFCREKRKKPGKEAWVLSGVERETGLFFLTEAPDCSARTLRDVLAKFVQPGTRIITEGDWANQGGVFDCGGYVHDVYVHRGGKSGFVDPEDSTLHTNCDKVLWSRVKRTLQAKKEAALNSYLHQWMFQNRAKSKGQGCFESFLLAIQVICRTLFSTRLLKS